MLVEKVNFTGAEPSQSGRSYVNGLSTKPSAPEDKEKSNAAKYMIGAAALAGVTALAIISHKNNWWRKAAEGTRGLTRNRVDYSDFSKIEGELTEDGSKIIKNKEGRVVKEIIKDGEDGVVFVRDYDPKTGEPVKLTCFAEDGKTVRCITVYNHPTRGMVSTRFAEDGKTVKFIGEHDPETGRLVKSTEFAEDGKTVKFIGEHDPETGRLVKSTEFAEDGKTVKNIKLYGDFCGYFKECDPAAGKAVKPTQLAKDGETVITFCRYKKDI